MRLTIFVHTVSLLTLCRRSVASGDARCASPSDGACESLDLQEDEVGLLQARISEHAFTRNAAARACQVGDHVPCPGSGVSCAGDQCCPGFDGGLNFPCPSASAGWGSGYCQSPAKVEDCLEDQPLAGERESTNTITCYAG